MHNICHLGLFKISDPSKETSFNILKSNASWKRLLLGIYDKALLISHEYSQLSHRKLGFTSPKGRQRIFWVSFLVAQVVEKSAYNGGDLMQETQLWSLGQEDPLEKGMTTHSSILAWEIQWTEEPGGLQSMGLQRVEQGWGMNALTLSLSPSEWSSNNITKKVLSACKVIIHLDGFIIFLIKLFLNVQ